MSKIEPRYLGDAVYASEWGAGGIILTTGSHITEHIAEEAYDTIFLEPPVIEALARYLKDWKEAQ